MRPTVASQLRQMERFWANLGHPEHGTLSQPHHTTTVKPARPPRQRKLNPEAVAKLAMALEAKRQLRVRLIAHFGGKCQDCGVVGPAAIYQFDHRDPFTKVKNVSSCWDWESALAEAEKCDLVCCNCHAIRTQADTERIQRKMAHNRVMRRLDA